MLNDFEYKKYLEIKRMSIEELNKYYRALRSYEYENNIPLVSSKIKKKIHKLSMLILKIDRLTTGRKLVIYDDKRGNYKDINKGKIYAASHVGRYDIESAMEAIDDQAYFVMGDPEETYRNFEGFYLSKIQGRICMDTGYDVFNKRLKLEQGKNLSSKDIELINEYKQDRNICMETCTKRVLNKDNILIYPEGAWNITDRLTQRLFKGTAVMAIKGNGVIVPIGIVKDDKKYTVNIGNIFDVKGSELSDAEDITKELQEKINSLKGEIIFNESTINKRSSMGTPKENLEAFKKEIMDETVNGYTEDVIINSRYYDKDAPENVFKTLKRLNN